MCGVVEAATIKSEPESECPTLPLSTLCLPSGAPITLSTTEAALLLSHSAGSQSGSPPTISIQEQEVGGGAGVATDHGPAPHSCHTSLPYTVTLAQGGSGGGGQAPALLSALLPLPLPPPLRSPLLSISEVTNTLLDHNQ